MNRGGALLQRVKAAVFVAFFALPVVASAQKKPVAAAREHTRLDLAPPGVAFKDLQVDNPLGSVRIQGHDKSTLIIETDKSAPDAESLDRLRVSMIPDGHGSVKIVAAADQQRESNIVPLSALRIDLVIKVPRATRIDGRVASGELTVSNVDGGGSLDAASGAILVSNVAGDFVTNSVTGAQQFTSVFGTLDSSAIDAQLKFESVSGQSFAASVHHGGINARKIRSKQIALTSTDGAIRYEGESMLGGQVTMRSLRGDITITLRRKGATQFHVAGAAVEWPKSYVGVAQVDANGVQHVVLGQDASSDETAVVTVYSRYGMVKLVAIQ
jgi:hypothetical protein